MGNALWVLAWGLFFFRGIETGNHFFQRYKDQQIPGAAEDEIVDGIMRMPAVSLLDVRVLAQSTLLAAPGFLNGMIRDDATYLFFVGVSLGAFLNALTPFASPEPQSEDLTHPAALVGKWALGKLDQTIKIVVIGGALILLSWIPWLGPLLKSWAGLAFGIVDGKPQTGFFADLVGVPFYGVLPMLLFAMVFGRFMLIASTRASVKGMFLISVACVFVGYQAMLDGAFSSVQRDLPSLPLTLTAMLAIDFTLMVTGLFIARAGQSRDLRSVR